MKKKNFGLNKEILQYLFFGVLTTVINYSVFAIGIHLSNNHLILIINLIAFCAATVFAFITNKIFVFSSNSSSYLDTLYELMKFVLARIFSLICEQLGLFVGIQYLEIEQYAWWNVSALMILKIILSFVSVALNYLASKFIVFADRERKEV